MKRYLILLLTLVFASCTKDVIPDPYSSTDFDYAKGLSHGQIVLGEHLENPYKVENVEMALQSLYPTKARTEVETTNLYVRFLPANEDELALLDGLELTDYPLDYALACDGDWYHDPSVPENDVTWMYAVVPADYVFPKVRYEIIDECFISENRAVTRAADDVDWDSVMRESYRLTGNADMLVPVTKAEQAAAPSGRITIVDPDADGGKPVGVKGVQVVCNSFVKFAIAYTDEDGYYDMKTTYTSDVKYRLVFKNKKSFALGFNFILVPASVSTLGKTGASGVNITVTDDSDEKLFRRCVINNAAYDYLERCGEDDLNITPPPSDLRIWVFPDLEVSSAIMMHHGTILDKTKLSVWLGVYAPIVTYFAPDITMGTLNKTTYKDLYVYTAHELAHASHFAQVGKSWWDEYIMYIVSSFLATNGTTYGTGTEKGAGYCEVGEMWGYYLQSKIHKDRYGGNMPSYGTAWWFYPQIFRYLEERGIPTSDLLAAMKPEVTSKELLKSSLETLYPGKKRIIEQVFSRYE